MWRSMTLGDVIGIRYRNTSI